MQYDHEYVNLSNPYHVIKWTLCGQYVEIGGECTAEQLRAMDNLDDVPGFVLVDVESNKLVPEIKKEVETLIRLGDPEPLAIRTAIVEHAKKKGSGAYELHYT
ncbi:hypothetical protein [Vibrio phage vB_ValS_PJ32]|nr:hypothetical protein [Vibrio phage vB_ValS_PJ32]